VECLYFGIERTDRILEYKRTEKKHLIMGFKELPVL